MYPGGGAISGNSDVRRSPYAGHQPASRLAARRRRGARAAGPAGVRRAAPRGERPSPAGAPWPRLAASRARAVSTSTRRIMRAVVEKKCTRFCQRTTRQSRSRTYVSWTRSVGCQPAAPRSPASIRLAISRSWRCTSGASCSSASASPRLQAWSRSVRLPSCSPLRIVNLL